MDKITEILINPRIKAAPPSGLARSIYDSSEEAQAILTSTPPFLMGDGDDILPYTRRVNLPKSHTFKPEELCKTIQCALGVRFKTVYALDHPLVTHTLNIMTEYMSEHGLVVDKDLSEFTFYYNRQSKNKRASGRIDLVLMDAAGKRLVCELKSMLTGLPLSERIHSPDPDDLKKVQEYRFQVCDYANMLLREGYKVFNHALVINILLRDTIELFHFSLVTPYAHGHSYFSTVKCLRDVDFTNTYRFKCTVCEKEFIRREGANTHFNDVH